MGNAQVDSSSELVNKSFKNIFSLELIASKIVQCIMSVKKLSFVLALILSVLSVSTVNAEDSEQELRALLAEIANVSKDLNESDIPKIQKLKRFKYAETADVLLLRLDKLFTDYVFTPGNNEARIKLMPEIIETLKDVATTQHNQLLSEVVSQLKGETMRWLELGRARAEEHLKTASLDKIEVRQMITSRINEYNEYWNTLNKELKSLEELKAFVLRERVPEFPSLPEVPHAYEYWMNEYRAAKASGQALDTIARELIFLEDIEKIEKELRSRVMGQDHAIESLLKLELDLYLRGYTREKPVIRFLMGLPGTGKDTIAEAYVDAIYRENGAHKKHLFRMPTVRSTHDVWGVIGSGKGYVGSTGPLPEFIQFLVDHSGGRYRYTNENKVAIEENPNWKPGMILPGYYPPEKAVVFINEGHNWSMQAFDELLKQALEKGYIKVNTSNGGLEKIFVPVTFLFASNHGISQLAARDIDGRATGKPKTYQELEEAWQLLKDDKLALRNALFEYNGKPAAGHGETLGMSEEFANRIKDEELILMRPLSPESLQKIINIKFEELAESYRSGKSGFGTLELEISDKLVEFIQSYRYNAEAGARPMEDKLQAIVDEVYQAVKNKDLNPKGAKHIYLDIRENSDKTKSLLFNYGGNRSSTLFERVISMTLKDKQLEKTGFEEFDKLAELPNRLSERIYGNPEATKGIGEAVAIAQMARESYMNNRDEHKKATSFGLFGYAGLGKTQTAKELSKALTGSENFMIVDFNYMDSLEKFEQEFIGQKRGTQVIKSKFMTEYDKRMGSTMVVLLEEVANAPLELLKRLYPFFDESVVRVFADGKERPMSNVIFLVTGNAGIEIYDDIMRLDLPRDVKMAALGWVYEEFVKDVTLQHHVLSKKIPVPLLTRFTDIFHYRPINHEILRNLSQRFLVDGLNSLKPKDGVIGWNVGFRSEADYHKLITVLEREGFEFENQGRSIRNYVTRNIENSLKLLLAKNHVPEGTRVALAPRDNQGITTVEKQGWKVYVDVFVEGRSEPILFEMEAQRKDKQVKENIDAHKRTAIHEAGHNVTAKILLGDKMRPTFLSIIPGVAEIMGKYIYYAGVAESRQTEKIEWTRQAVVEKIAVSAAGAKAQQLTTKGYVDDAGKSNDMEQATFMAKRAVMEWGLSSRFRKSVNQKDSAALALLSEAERTIISEEVDKLIAEGDKLSEKLLTENFELLIKLANVLLEKGKMTGAEIDQFYKDNEHLVKTIADPRAAAQVSLYDRIRVRVGNILGMRGSKTHNPEFIDGLKITENIANIKDVVEADRQKELAKVAKPEIPLFADMDSNTVRRLTHESSEQTVARRQLSRAASAGGTCHALFR